MRSRASSLPCAALPLDRALAALVQRLLAVREHALELGLGRVAGRRHPRSVG